MRGRCGGGTLAGEMCRLHNPSQRNQAPHPTVVLPHDHRAAWLSRARPALSRAGAMLGAPMRHRVLSLSLALLLLLTQQLGAAHLLSHVLHPGGLGPAHADHGHAAAALVPADTAAATHADAGDALCQVCLVLATLLAAALPTLWRWRLPRLWSAALALPATQPPARRPGAPYRARGPPGLPAPI